MNVENITVLGSTGSIGQNTLDVIRRNPERFRVKALGAGSNVGKMFSDVKEFRPDVAVLADKDAALELERLVRAEGDLGSVRVEGGYDVLSSIASLPDTDSVMAAISGSAGLVPALAAIKAGKKIYLANKESLIMTGHLFIDEARRSHSVILPVDSEHNAMFQCLPEIVQQSIGYCDMKAAGVSKLLLTGSGGPFRKRDISTFDAITPEEAVAHPTWSMGRKISVDSATMMNKGFEFIEAKWLFNAANDQISVIIHPESMIHSMVQYRDGAVLAEIGNPDMRTPIARVMSYPDRIDSGVGPVDFFAIEHLEFIRPDFSRYPCLKLAIDSCWSGQSATTALNAANEKAVAAFLDRRIRFTDIVRVCSETVSRFSSERSETMEDVFALDSAASAYASDLVRKYTI